MDGREIRMQTHAGEKTMKIMTTTKSSSNNGCFHIKAGGWGSLWLLIVAVLISPAYAADDDVPFFAGANGAPNIMFIFDNSDSMQDIPYRRADGRSVRPGTNPNSLNNSSASDWMWRRGVKLNADNTVMEVAGVVQYDEAAFPSETEMAIPEQTPENLPGKSSLTSNADVNDPVTAKVLPEQTPANLPGTSPASLTSSMTSIANVGRIYDTSLTWTDALLTDATTFNSNYRYRLVEVRDKDGGLQYRTITGRDTANKYFTIDTAAVAGGALVYNAALQPYTYTILTDGPGRVTRGVSTTTLTDADIDWSSVEANWTNWNGKLLTVTAGTNMSQTRTISGYSVANKSWTVAAFPVACDQTTRYEIKAATLDPERIYDASLDWTTAGTALTDNTKFNLNYLYRVVEVLSATGTVQQRTIVSRNTSVTSGKYFTVDITSAAGGPLVYIDGEKPYTYTILTDGPGRVTRARPDNTPNRKYLTDADLDWTTINGEFDAKWNNRTLEITAGTNKGLKRRITNRSTSSKYWQVDVEFPANCDLTTRYKIEGTADDNRYAFGGNHPASKLYQAKKATQLFLADPTLKTCIETNADLTCKTSVYALNMGFATYLSARVPRITAKYYRIQAGYTYDPPAVPDRYCGTYKRIYDDSGTFTSGSGTTFETTGWKTAPVGSTAWEYPQVHTGVIANTYQFDRLINEGSCQQQVVRYTVTNIETVDAGDGSFQYKYTVRSRVATEGGRWEAVRRCYTVASCAAIPATDGAYNLIPSGANCYSACTLSAGYDNPPYTTPDLYQTIYRDTFGNYNLTTDTVPQYVNRTTHLVNPWYGYNGTGGTPKNPPFASGDYQLITAPLLNKATAYNSSTGVTTYSDIQPDTFDTSYFMYPGYGTTDRPHGWSYKRTFVPDSDPATPDSPMWIYGQSGYWEGAEFPKTGSAGYSSPTYYGTCPACYWPGDPNKLPAQTPWAWATWKDADQKDPYFPAVLGDEMSNFTGDDQAVFVNLPVYDGANPHFGDDIGGLNLTKILEYTSLARVPSPNDYSTASQLYDYTIMPYSNSIAPNAYSALKGSGTPLAASLQDLKKYYESYIKQDSMTQGGCRKNYVILLTDGLETGSSDPAAPVQAAKDLLELKIDGEAYPIETYVIGLGLDAASQATLNAIAAAGTLITSEHPTPRNAYFANNVEQLVDILVKEITSQIIGGSYSRSAAAITTYKPGEDLHLYSSYFDYPSWRGHLKGYNVNSGDGSIIGPATGWVGDCDGDGTPDADAGCEMKLNKLNGRNGRGIVYTSKLNAGVLFNRLAFDPNNSTSVTNLQALVNPLGLDIDGIDGANKPADAATIMYYTIDSGYDGDKYRGTRDTGWPLGDIYNSGMVVVGAPKFFPPSPPAVGVDPYKGYADGDSSIPTTDFKTDNAARATRIYVGANDGMVHAIKASDGQESWAYIPNSVLGKLYEFKEGHRFTVDLPLKAADIYSPGGAGTIWSSVVAGSEKSGWHTMLTGGLRGGGYSYFALDVTVPDDPKPAWEMTDGDADVTTRDMGKTWSTPATGRIMIDGVYTYVIIVGGGLSADTNKGNNLYIINAGSGAILKEINIGDSTNHVPSEILVIPDNDKSSANYGNIVSAYFGDTSGDLWKLTDLNDAAGGAAWSPVATRLHDGVGKVFHKPAISKSKGGCVVPVGGVDYTINTNTTFILYGTGDEEDPTNTGTTDHMYEIADPALTVANSTITLSKVWERQFSNGEKMLTDPFVSLGTVYFITYSPEGGCAQGESFLWGLTISKCGNAGNTAGIVFDLAGNTGGGSGSPWERLSLGAGIRPTPTDGGPVIYIGGEVPTVIKKPTTSRLEYWREDF